MIMNNEKNERIEKRHYENISTNDIIHIPKKFRTDYLSLSDPEILLCPILSMRILAKITNDVSFDQYRKENPRQIQVKTLFDKEFKTKNNTFARFTFQISEITKTRDYIGLSNALEFLENFKRGWHHSKNEKGKTIKSYGGLITNSSYSKGKITFLISSYWLEKIVELGDYNKVLYNLLFDFKNSKTLLLYLWILEINHLGLKVSLDKIQKAFDYNYKDTYEFGRNVLKPLKKRLDKHSDRSFNFQHDKKNIVIKPYFLKDVPKISEKTNKNLIITQKLNYWKQRHSLDDENKNILKNIIKEDSSSYKLFIDAYSDIVRKTNKDKDRTMKDYKNNDFMIIFQEQIKETYSNSKLAKLFKNGYPKLIN